MPKKLINSIKLLRKLIKLLCVLLNDKILEILAIKLEI